LGLEALVEINDADEAAMAVRAGATLIGINNRDLRTFRVDPERTRRLLPLLPAEAAVISASGIQTPADALRAHRAGADACLVGEALMRAPDPVAWLRSVLAGEEGEPDACTGPSPMD
ncbi:MAG TPA: indole-3-glycerol-phosphate synthase TrpC, partial [Bacillota bacterium]